MQTRPRVIIPNHVFGTPVPFAQQHYYMAHHQVAEMTTPDYFLSMRSRFRPGDSIRLIQTEVPGTLDADNKVLDAVDAIVTSVSEEGVFITPLLAMHQTGKSRGRGQSSAGSALSAALNDAD